MRRRHFGAMALTACASLLLRRGFAATAQDGSETVKGKLIQHGDSLSILETAEGRLIKLAGDEDTQKVLRDPRLAGVELEALGHFHSPDQFTVGPIYEKNMFVLQDGKPRRITYWCDICSIRTYAPGVCVCCQKWTDLDLRDPNQE